MRQRVVVTEDPEGLRTLRFEQGGARQSVVWPGEPLRLEIPYTRMSMAGLAFVPEPERILVVGLGGGAIPMFLRAVLPEVAIDVVDVEPDVVEAAKLYCGFQEDDALRVHVADGRSFIEASGPAYSLIVLDAYGPDNIPPHLATREFLGAARARLTADGAVLGNVWESVSNPLFPSMLRTWRVSFPQLHRLDVPSTTNRILVGLSHTEAYSHVDLVDRAARLERELGLPFELGRMVSRGHRQVPRRVKDGHILTDAALD
ncbi:spermidine synthase [Pyxidicoccus xibeiensis]|uniref:spermidine synthase n=1 Tax=Pyxidicoccus xibeiensis TaxID=2906759 RepID=UPI0020A769FB|nr:fused MFS/spermidine synthase [Pyxidicoccus xibeiensis]MCP3137944.1 fused MFS/spermidine synthase [Pyxidicoccus xibeiensis]